MKSVKPKKNRVLVLPIKRYLAKAMIYNEMNIFKILTNQEKQEWETFFNDKTGTCEIPCLYSRLGDLERNFTQAFKPYIDIILKEQTLIKPYNSTISYYTNRKNLPPHLKNYDLNNYSLLKIEIRVLGRKDKTEKLYPYPYDYLIKSINNSLDFWFKFFVFNQLDNRDKKSIEQTVSDLFILFNLKEIEYQKNALIRSYYRYKSKSKKVIQ